jgi:hypothetical protein
LLIRSIVFCNAELECGRLAITLRTGESTSAVRRAAAAPRAGALLVDQDGNLQYEQELIMMSK